jgi:hypothetical protein
LKPRNPGKIKNFYMKKASDIIAQLRQTFNELVKNAEVPQTPEGTPAPIMAKLNDGTEIMISEMIVGGVVMVDGNPIPAGNYTLEDGTALVIGDNGVISEIVAPTAPATDETNDGSAEMVNQLKNQFQKFEAVANQRFSAYENKFKDYESRLAKATKVIEGLLNLTQTLAETPTGNPDPAVKGSQIFKAEKSKNDAAMDILFT